MKIGIIGGSGLYDIEGLENLREEALGGTPFGPPSDSYFVGELGDAELVFLPRHGRGHRIMPSELNHRANIFGMKQLDVELIVSISAVGSFREELAPGDMVLVDQFVDRTKEAAAHTFFGNGIAAHIAFSQPTCSRLRAALLEVVQGMQAQGGLADAKVHNGGTYVNMAGPAFSTLAESDLYRSWGMDVIGMTNLAEAKLAREAEICYQTIAMVTDYDCWRQAHEAVTVETIIATLMKNAGAARAIIKQVVPALSDVDFADCPCRCALETAIITDPSVVSAEIKDRLAPILGKYMH